MDSARALIARGWGVSLVSRCLRVSRAQLHVILRRTDDWMDGRRSRHTDDTDVLFCIHHVTGDRRVYQIMRQSSLLPERKLREYLLFLYLVLFNQKLAVAPYKLLQTMSYFM